ncbi:hypothetical protein HYZ82_01715 [Candidatus Nomurabacteria bacterium]|nr:hypothetical protein [Candidatus Nomurabacteria bacterium]
MEPEKKSNGAFIGLIVIIIILVIGGIYIWQSNKDTSQESGGVTENDSIELSNLEAELDTTDTSTGVDASTVE